MHAAKVLCLLCCFVWTAVPMASAQTFQGIVTRYADGDSFYISGIGIRLEGIDTAETGDRCTKDGNPWNCKAPAARALRSIIGSGPITCVSEYCDRHKRHVSVCRADGKDIGEQMVRSGWAIDWPHFSHHRYKAAQEEARREKRGMWADGVQLSPRLAERMNSDPAKFKRYLCE